MGFNFSVESLLNANVVSFGALCIIIGFLIYRLKIVELLEKQSIKIKSIVDNSEENKLNSEKELLSANNELNHLPDDIAKIKAEAENTALTLVEHLKEETIQKKQIIENNKQRALELELKKNREILSKEVSIAAVLMAKDSIKNLLENDPNLHKKIINECIDRL